MIKQIRSERLSQTIQEYETQPVWRVLHNGELLTGLNRVTYDQAIDIYNQTTPSGESRVCLVCCPDDNSLEFCLKKYIYNGLYANLVTACEQGNLYDYISNYGYQYDKQQLIEIIRQLSYSVYQRLGDQSIEVEQLIPENLDEYGFFDYEE